MASPKLCIVDKIVGIITDTSRPVRKHCNPDAFIRELRTCFQAVPDSRAQGKVRISMDDALMSAFAMFSFKDPSMLAFDRRRQEAPRNLHSIFGIKNIPCDSQMRDILDVVDPKHLRPGFKAIFRALQRGKDLEPMTFLDGHYLVSGDGTGFYSSSKVSSEYCLRKKSRNGETLYQLQMYAAAIVHPEFKTVIPFCPEMITRSDGETKQDCERKASLRFWEQFRREHPHLKTIVIEDGLGSNGPHIRDLQRLNLRFILGAKPGDHKFLFERMEELSGRGEVAELSIQDPKNPKVDHAFRFANGVPLNKSNQDLLVNVLEYWQVDAKGKEKRFSWVTDMTITEDNVYDIMRAARARWRIENETFNTLKNQDYNLGHNYGLGKKHLSAVLTTLMMLAFLVDQALQLGCWLFEEALKKAGCKRDLWEQMRGAFREFQVESMETIYRRIVFGIKGYIVELVDNPTG